MRVNELLQITRLISTLWQCIPSLRKGEEIEHFCRHCLCVLRIRRRIFREIKVAVNNEQYMNASLVGLEICAM